MQILPSEDFVTDRRNPNQSNQLGAKEWREHEAQQRRMRGLVLRINAHDWDVHRLGSYFISVREAGLWKRDPRYDQMAFVDYVGAVLCDRDWSRTTIERHITVSASYSFAEYRALRLHKTGFTVLAEVQRLPQAIRDGVLRLAAKRQITAADLEVARETAQNLLLAPPTQEQLDKALSDAILRRRQAPNRRNRPRGGGEGQGGGGGGDDQALLQRQREFEKEQARLLDERRDADRRKEELRRHETELLRARAEVQQRIDAQKDAEQRLQQEAEALRRRLEEHELAERLRHEAQVQGVEIDGLLKQEYQKLLLDREGLKADVIAVERMRAEAQSRLAAADARGRQVDEAAQTSPRRSRPSPRPRKK